jgi:hypothetical protein
MMCKCHRCEEGGEGKEVEDDRTLVIVFSGDHVSIRFPGRNESSAVVSKHVMPNVLPGTTSHEPWWSTV